LLRERTLRIDTTHQLQGRRSAAMNESGLNNSQGDLEAVLPMFLVPRHSPLGPDCIVRCCANAPYGSTRRTNCRGGAQPRWMNPGTTITTGISKPYSRCSSPLATRTWLHGALLRERTLRVLANV